MAKGKKTAEIYEEVTQRIIDSLEKGIIPWNKPWVSMGGHKNYVSQKPYRGINPFLLQISSIDNDFVSPFWLTYNQASELSVKKWLKDNNLTDTDDNRAAYKNDENGYKGVRKGEKSTTIIFWNTFTIEDKDNRDENGKPEKKTIPYLKYISIFNTDQTDLGIEIPEISDKQFDPIEEAQSVIDDWPDRPEINHGGDIASYIPSYDQITMPLPEMFDSENYYYKTLYHEAIHSTGHKSRLNRIKESSGFGSDPYAKEELVAELGAAIMMNYVGIETPETDKNTEAYIKSWIKRFKEDSKLIISAGSKAQKAADYIIGAEDETETDDKG